MILMIKLGSICSKIHAGYLLRARQKCRSHGYSSKQYKPKPHLPGPDILLQWDVLSKHELAIDISSLLIWQEK